MNYTEHAFMFDCAGDRLLGISTHPEIASDTGVLILVGGPQYRAGSHRQFTLLARQLADDGITSMRFDFRGMGDSEGDSRTFETVNEDIRAALDAFVTRQPDLRRIALWGLCDAASAAMLYAHTDARVNGMILLNPWVHSEAGAARTRLRHYYLTRLTQPSFWKKLLTGKIALGESASDLSKSAQSAMTTAPTTPTNPRLGTAGYIDRMLDGLQRYRGEVLIVLSGNDLVAQEFSALTKNDKDWKRIMQSPRITQSHIQEANHTCSSQEWREKVASRTSAWLAARHPAQHERNQES